MSNEHLELVVKIVAVSLSLISSLVLLERFKNEFNRRALRAINFLSGSEKSEIFSVIWVVGFFGLIVLIIGTLTHLVIPGHDFVLFRAPSLHAFFSGVRTIVLYIAGILAFPLLLTGWLFLITAYVSLLIRFALILVGDKTTSLVSISLGVATTVLLLLEFPSIYLVVACSLGLGLLFFAIWYTWLKTAPNLSVRSIASYFSVFVLKVSLATCAAALSGGLLYLAYFDIFIADNEIVEWPSQLDCDYDYTRLLDNPNKYDNFFTISDIFLAVSQENRGIFNRIEITELEETFTDQDLAPSIAVKTSGLARYARILVTFRSANTTSAHDPVAYSGAGGYFLDKGYFVFSNFDVTQALGETPAGRVTLFISVMPDGRYRLAKPDWFYQFEQDFILSHPGVIEDDFSLTPAGQIEVLNYECS